MQRRTDYIENDGKSLWLENSNDNISLARDHGLHNNKLDTDLADEIGSKPPRILDWMQNQVADLDLHI